MRLLDVLRLADHAALTGDVTQVVVAVVVEHRVPVTEATHVVLELTAAGLGWWAHRRLRKRRRRERRSL